MNAFTFSHQFVRADWNGKFLGIPSNSPNFYKKEWRMAEPLSLHMWPLLYDIFLHNSHHLNVNFYARGRESKKRFVTSGWEKAWEKVERKKNSIPTFVNRQLVRFWWMDLILGCHGRCCFPSRLTLFSCLNSFTATCRLGGWRGPSAATTATRNWWTCGSFRCGHLGGWALLWTRRRTHPICLWTFWSVAFGRLVIIIVIIIINIITTVVAFWWHYEILWRHAGGTCRWICGVGILRWKGGGGGRRRVDFFVNHQLLRPIVKFCVVVKNEKKNMSTREVRELMTFYIFLLSVKWYKWKERKQVILNIFISSRWFIFFLDTHSPDGRKRNWW